MKINGLRVDNFGVWSRLSLTDLSDRVTLLHGRNEAGKTTLLDFIRSALYGLSQRRRARYMSSAEGANPSGSLLLETPDGSLEVFLSAGEALTADHFGVHEEAVRQLLGHIDEAIFNNVFAIGLRDMQQLGALNETEASDFLYNLTVGVDRVSLVQVMRDLAVARRQVLSEDGQPSEISRLLDRQQTLRKDVEELARQGQRWSQAAQELQLVVGEVEQLEQQLHDLRTQAAHLELTLKVHEPWLERNDIQRRIDRFVVLPKLDKISLEAVEEMDLKIKEHQQRLDEIRAQQTEIVDESKHLPIDRTVLANGARIDVLQQQATWVSSMENLISRLRTESQSLDQELRSYLERAGIQGSGVVGKLLELPENSLAELRQPANALARSARHAAKIRRQHEQHQKKAEQLDRQLTNELSQLEESSLPVALESAGTQVTKLRRRIQTEERLEKLARTRVEVEEDIDELLDQQILPAWQLGLLAIPFGFGVLLIVCSLAWPQLAAVGWPLALLGLGAWAIAVGIKYVLEINTSRELETCNDRLEQIRGQIKAARQQCEELDSELISTTGPPDVRLQNAQQRLERLEKLLPIETNRQQARRDAADSRDQLTIATEARRKARRQWQAALKARDLPPEWPTKVVRSIAVRLRQNAGNRARLTATREEIQQRKRDVQAFYERVHALCREIGLAGDIEDPPQQLQALVDALQQQRPLVQRRRALRDQHRQLQREGRKLARQRQQIWHSRERTLAAAGVRTTAELREVFAKHAELRGLHKKCASLDEQIEKTLSGTATTHEVAQTLAEFGNAARLEEAWNEFMTQIESSEEQLAQLHQQQGQLQQEMKTLAEDRRLGQARLELGRVKQQLKEAVERWQVLAVTCLVLETIRQTYETDHQPETLQEASHYLSLLTDGKYTRIWIPFGETNLMVDYEGNQSLAVEMLSRGTREAVYLSLRLALVGAYQRQGIQLPLILDDVLVNLDGDRIKAASRTLRDFAKSGHQILVFTCHDHILKAFKAVKADVRQLPSHSGTDRPAAVPKKPVDQPREKPTTAITAPDVDDPPSSDHLVEIPQESQVTRSVSLPWDGRGDAA